MFRRKKGSVQWLEFENLSQFSQVSHGVFLREGGSSLPPYASLNLGPRVGDSQLYVSKNLQAIAPAIGTPFIVYLNQCHGDQVIEVTTLTNGLVSSCDGLCTAMPEQALMITHADCQAAIFYDPVNNAIGNFHVGWRGNVADMYAKAVAYMKKAFHSKPEDLIVGIGPSLGPCCAEFINYKKELPESFWTFQEKENYFNLWAISLMQLEKAGVLSSNVEIAKMCTKCHAGDFFSYRRDQITGRNGTLICLKS